MRAGTRTKGKIMLCTGNQAAAYGVLLCHTDVIAIYPITPQSPLIEQLAQFRAEGRLDAEIIEVEGENSAMSAVTAASIAGGRVFTATSSLGLAFMYDSFLAAAGERAPVVMVNVNRETPGMATVSCGRQDMMSVRDSGWIQIEAENGQEIHDSVIMAYRLAEDLQILLPIMVSYDGFYLSYLADEVEIRPQEAVNRFLSPLSQAKRVRLDPEEPLSFRGVSPPQLYTEYRYKHCAALERAKGKLAELSKEFEAAFGVAYGGEIEEYRADDAEIVLVSMGSATGTAREVVDKKRAEGLSIGLIKIRMFRPFPVVALAQALAGKKAIGVIDRSVCFGWNCGHIFMELNAIAKNLGSTVPMVDFIDGLDNGDITIEHIERMAEITRRASQGESVPTVTWLALE